MQPGFLAELGVTPVPIRTGAQRARRTNNGHQRPHTRQRRRGAAPIGSRPTPPPRPPPDTHAAVVGVVPHVRGVARARVSRVALLAHQQVPRRLLHAPQGRRHPPPAAAARPGPARPPMGARPAARVTGRRAAGGKRGGELTSVQSRGEEGSGALCACAQAGREAWHAGRAPSCSARP